MKDEDITQQIPVKPQKQPYSKKQGQNKNLPTKQKPAKAKTPKRISPDYLRNAGKYYLERFPASTEQFSKVMMRKIHRSLKHHTDLNIEDCTVWLQTICIEFQNIGMLNDTAYANALFHSLQRKGTPSSRIFMTLSQKGVPKEIINTIKEKDEETQSPDHTLIQGLRWAKRKRLPPFSLNKPKEKALSALGRAGFDYETAVKIISMDEDSAETILNNNNF